jgi:hypothetical protein
MGRSTISMAIFNSFLYVYRRVDGGFSHVWFEAIPIDPPWDPHVFRGAWLPQDNCSNVVQAV